MPFATPAERSPIPQAEAPRDCPLCPRLVRFRQECRAEFPDWWNAPVPAFGDRTAWLGIVGLALSGSAKDVVEKKIVEKDVPEKKDEKKDSTPPKPPEPPLDPIKAAEKALADAKIATDSKSLLEFFRTRTLGDEDRAKLLTTIRRSFG